MLKGNTKTALNYANTVFLNYEQVFIKREILSNGQTPRNNQQ